MTQLNHTIREIACTDGSSAVLVAIDGSVDPASIDEFDAIFDELISGGNKRIIMDVENLKYINSTGMGIMVQYYDQLAEDGGALVLMSVNAKITLVLEMLGLQELFPIVANETEAIAALLGEYTPPANVQVRLADCSGSGAANGKTEKCGLCGAELLFTVVGDYLCPRCRAFLTFDGDKVETKKAIIEKGFLELTIPAEAGFYKSAGAMAARLSMRAGFSDTDARALADSCTNALTLFAATGMLHLFVGNINNRLVVHIYGNGKKDAAIFEPLKANFTKIDSAAINGGALLTLEKTK